MTGLVVFLVMWLASVAQADITPFVGSYAGSAEMQLEDGGIQRRDLSVEIEAQKKDAFQVSWTTVTYKSDGRTKEKSYEIVFVPTDRDGVFAAAQKKNVFGHEVQNDPMKGEPYVWARIVGETLTVFSLFVDDAGGYEIQQFDRTLSEGGLNLVFNRLRNGEKLRAISTFLAKE